MEPWVPVSSGVSSLTEGDHGYVLRVDSVTFVASHDTRALGVLCFAYGLDHEFLTASTRSPMSCVGSCGTSVPCSAARRTTRTSPHYCYMPSQRPTTSRRASPSEAMYAPEWKLGFALLRRTTAEAGWLRFRPSEKPRRVRSVRQTSTNSRRVGDPHQWSTTK